MLCWIFRSTMRVKLQSKQFYPYLRVKIRNGFALSGIDLKIKKGSVVGIIGDNGAGKSTLLRVIGGIYEPDREISLFMVMLFCWHHSD